MANDYYNNTTNTVIDGTSADASDVENKLDDVAAGFDTLQVDMDKTLNLTMTDITSRDFNITKALRSGKNLGFDAVGELTILTNDSGSAADEAEAARDIAVAAALAAGVSEDNAADSELAASVSEDNASDSADLAYEWANEAEDVVVAGGEYSAYHWAKKAEDWGTVISDSTTTLTTTWSSTEIDSEVDTRIEDRVQKFGTENLFDNPSFTVKQKGTEVSIGYGYVTDRWHGIIYTTGTTVGSATWKGIDWTSQFPTMRVRTNGTVINTLMFSQNFPRFTILNGQEFTVRFKIYLYSGLWNPISSLKIGYKLDGKIIENGVTEGVLTNLNNTSGVWTTVEATFTADDPTTFTSVGLSFENMGVPSSTGDNVMNIGEAQLYIGEPPAFSPVNQAEEILKCQQWYYAPSQTATDNEGGYLKQDVTAGSLYKTNVFFPVEMFAVPTITAGPTNGSNFTFSGFDGTTKKKTMMRATAVATAAASFASSTFTASAEF